MNIKLEEFNISNIKSEYKALEDGLYDAKIKDVSLMNSKNGKKMMCVTLELQGEKMVNGVHLGGRNEKYYIVLEDKYAGQKLHSLLTACGVDVKAGDNINIQQLVTSNVMSYKLVKAKLKKTNYINANNEVKECNAVSYITTHPNQNIISDIITSDDIPF